MIFDFVFPLHTLSSLKVRVRSNLVDAASFPRFPHHRHAQLFLVIRPTRAVKRVQTVHPKHDFVAPAEVPSADVNPHFKRVLGPSALSEVLPRL